VTDAADTLRQLGAARIGVNGFCMGGRYAWYTAVHGDGFAAAVGFYDGGIGDEFGQPRCPTLLFFGGQDPYIAPAEIERVAGHHLDTVVYPEASHGFMRDGSESYHEESALDAWTRTLSFFDEYLRYSCSRPPIAQSENIRCEPTTVASAAEGPSSHRSLTPDWNAPNASDDVRGFSPSTIATCTKLTPSSNRSVT
jgi:hypothetical protein